MDAALPRDGMVLVVQFDGRLGVMWFEPDEDGQDRVATLDGSVREWASAAECAASALASGWAADEPDVLDLEPVVLWLRGRRPTVDPVAALNLWNVAGDVARSTGRRWADRGTAADRCYDKLVAANVPWLTVGGTYVPRWSPREIATLRRVLGAAVHVLRSSLRQPRSAGATVDP